MTTGEDDKEGNKKKIKRTTDTAEGRTVCRGVREREGTPLCGAPQRDPPSEGVTAATDDSCFFIRRRGPAPLVRETGPAPPFDRLPPVVENKRLL